VTSTLDASPLDVPDAEGPQPVGIGMLLTLLAGRSIFRIVLYGANLALLSVWSRADFDRYAAASAGLAWVVALTQAGPEKAALTLIPRMYDARAALTSGLVFGIRLVTVLLGAVAAGALIVDRHGTLALYLIMAAESAAVGCNLAAVGTLRALGRTRSDPRNFVILSTGWVAITLLAIAVSMDPTDYVILQFLLTVGVTELTLAGVRAPIRSLTARRPVLRSLTVTVALMGVQDVVACLTTSAVFLLLPLTGHAGQSGDLYVAVAGWAIVLGFFTYLLRVFQPRVSLRLARSRGHDGRGWGRSLGCWALGINGAWLVVVAVTMQAPFVDRLSPGRSTVVILAVLLASHAPVALLNGLGLYLLENGDGESLRVAASAAVANLALVALVGVVVLPRYGAVGAVWAFAAGELAPAIVLMRQAR
jgi:hypothetical protein